MFRKNRCYNGGELHKFEARYDVKKTPVTLSDNVLNSCFVTAIPEMIRNNIETDNKYRYDICVWCGKVVKENKDEKETKVD